MSGLRVLQKDFLFEAGSQSFQSCHCSSIIQNEEGDLLVTYFAGEHEGSADQGIWISRRTGNVWEMPRRIKCMYGFIHWNPLLHYENGITYLFYKVGMTVSGWYTMLSISHDFGRTWSESRELVEGDHTPRGSSKNKIILREDGTWLGPCSIEKTRDWDSFIDISRDKGKTWEKREIEFDHQDNEPNREVEWEDVGNLWLSDPETIMRWDGIIQPSIWKTGDSQYSALLRSTSGWLYRTDSEDNGETWSEAYPTDMPNNNSGIDLVKLGNGVVVLFYNPVSADWGSRTPLSAAVSHDQGKTWEKVLDLEKEPGEYSYPAAICKGNIIDISYTYQRSTIVHSTLIYE